MPSVSSLKPMQWVAFKISVFNSVVAFNSVP
jgi:hypothetical protein